MYWLTRIFHLEDYTTYMLIVRTKKRSICKENGWLRYTIAIYSNLKHSGSTCCFLDIWAIMPSANDLLTLSVASQLSIAAT